MAGWMEDVWGTKPTDQADASAVVTAIDVVVETCGTVSVVVTSTTETGEQVSFPADCAGRNPRDLARNLAETFDLVPIWRDTSWVAGTTPRPPADRYERRG